MARSQKSSKAITAQQGDKYIRLQYEELSFATVFMADLPPLKKANQTKRLKHKNWDPIQWEKVLWGDESKFKIFGTKRRQYMRRLGEELKECCLQPTIKHGGGSIQVWGCISSKGVGNLVRIDGMMTAKR